LEVDQSTGKSTFEQKAHRQNYMIIASFVSKVFVRANLDCWTTIKSSSGMAEASDSLSSLLCLLVTIFMIKKESSNNHELPDILIDLSLKESHLTTHKTVRKTLFDK
jgi:hypothetical protein